MTLLNSGYFSSTYWSEDYWMHDYWPEYGYGSNPPQMGAGTTTWLKSRRRVRHRTTLLKLFIEYLEIKLNG